jgi:hypothetical protein
VASLYDRVAVALGGALLLVGAFTVLTGRWPRRSADIARPRWQGGWALCLGLVGLGHLRVLRHYAQGDFLGPFDMTLTLFGLSVLALHLARRPLRPADRPAG